MRRIVKRTVTVLTTIAWTISWRHKGTKLVDVEPEPAANDRSEPPGEAGGQPVPWEIEATITKEVDVSQTQTTSHSMADQRPDTFSNQNRERKDTNP